MVYMGRVPRHIFLLNFDPVADYIFKTHFLKRLAIFTANAGLSMISRTLFFRLLADEGVEATILAPWQVEAPGIDLRRPVRIDLGAVGEQGPVAHLEPVGRRAAVEEVIEVSRAQADARAEKRAGRPGQRCADGGPIQRPICQNRVVEAIGIHTELYVTRSSRSREVQSDAPA